MLIISDSIINNELLVNTRYVGCIVDKRYYLADHLGSIRVVLNEQGNVDSWSDYYPFGKEARGSSTSNEPKEQFTGKERDIEIGLDYFGARYYNADVGRFITRDRFSAKFPHLTHYQYAANNPLRYIDENGDSIKVFGEKNAGIDMLKKAVKHGGGDSKMANRISLDENDMLQIDQTGYEGGNDLIDALISMSENKKIIGFEFFIANNESEAGPINKSETPRNESIGKKDPGLKEGFSGYLSLPVNVNYKQYYHDYKTNNPKARMINAPKERITGHEVLEQKYRTIEGLFYDESHNMLFLR